MVTKRVFEAVISSALGVNAVVVVDKGLMLNFVDKIVGKVAKSLDGEGLSIFALFDDDVTVAVIFGEAMDDFELIIELLSGVTVVETFGETSNENSELVADLLGRWESGVTVAVSSGDGTNDFDVFTVTEVLPLIIEDLSNTLAAVEVVIETA